VRRSRNCGQRPRARPLAASPARPARPIPCSSDRSWAGRRTPAAGRMRIDGSGLLLEQAPVDRRCELHYRTIKVEIWPSLARKRSLCLCCSYDDFMQPQGTADHGLGRFHGQMPLPRVFVRALRARAASSSKVCGSPLMVMPVSRKGRSPRSRRPVASLPGRTVRSRPRRNMPSSGRVDATDRERASR
jgi:hypothetical protein